jgi:signal transduction histidine kinase
MTRVATLGELTASITHEVNQPLTAVVTNGNACLRWLTGQTPNLVEARLAVERIIKDGHRASEVIKRICSLIKKAPSQKDWVDVNKIILEVIALARSEVLRNCVFLKPQLADDLPLVLGDRIQLQQVILNLIINGVEAIGRLREGPRELFISSGRDESNGLLVAVRDTGVGLDAAHLNQIFDPFFTTRPNGLGMGLAISRSIIEAHGGRLWATSNSPQGAVFQFTLPTGSKQMS